VNPVINGEAASGAGPKASMAEAYAKGMIEKYDRAVKDLDTAIRKLSGVPGVEAELSGLRAKREVYETRFFEAARLYDSFRKVMETPDKTFSTDDELDRAHLEANFPGLYKQMTSNADPANLRQFLAETDDMLKRVRDPAESGASGSVHSKGRSGHNVGRCLEFIGGIDVTGMTPKEKRAVVQDYMDSLGRA
jgi:hypothetical protein